MANIEIVCAACGAEALLRREPVFEGFRKTGERLLCSACGHAYDNEAEVPFKGQQRPQVFTAADKPQAVDVFEDDEKHRNCRYCVHYVVNPFTQWCGLHRRDVEATDRCDQFKRKPPAPVAKPPPPPPKPLL
ncbi:MAG: hypothetical protein K8T26_00345 [Lentisphaerae bacterium]|nr:hypothetical protein [Lentisphaerota bacterium]